MDTYDARRLVTDTDQAFAEKAGQQIFQEGSEEAAVARAYARKQVETEVAVDLELTRREAFATDLAKNMTYMKNIGNNPHLIHLHAKIILGGKPYTNARQKKPRFVFANLYPERSQPCLSVYWYAVQVALSNNWDEQTFIRQLMRVSVYNFKTEFALVTDKPIKNPSKPSGRITAEDGEVLMALFPKVGEFHGFESLEEPVLCIAEPVGPRRVVFRAVKQDYK